MSKIQDRIVIIETRIAKDTAELNDLRKQLEAAALVSEVAAGWTVKFKVGRQDTRREVQGEVLGRGLVKDVDSVRVTVGSGLAAELFTIAVTQLTGITAPGTKVADEAVESQELAVVSASDALLSEVLG